MEYYTYAYLRADGSPYYVGKGKGGRIYSKGNRVFNPPPKERCIYLKQNLTEQDAFKHEVYMIAVLGRKDLNTGILHNQSAGGVGGGAMKGRKHSEETKQRMREKALGRKMSKEARAKMSAQRKGCKWSDERNEKLSKSITEWWKQRKEATTNG